MDIDDPDLEVLESDLRAIIRARELCKTAALVSNLCPNASDPPLVGIFSRDDAQQVSHCCTLSDDQLMASLIRTMHQMIMNYPRNESLKGISTLLLAAGPQGKCMKTPLLVRWRSSIYQLFLFLFTTWKVFTILRQNSTGNC